MGAASIVLGGGCFWCLDPIFNRMRGVHEVLSGYAGGHVPNPSYAAVCTGTTGHAEVLQLQYDPDEISLETLLTVFFTFHDPTTLNRQGNDQGPQYRSIIFYQDKDEEVRIRNHMASLQAQGLWEGRPWVTELSGAQPFYPAEDHHQRYYESHGHTAYCAFVIAPKLDKFRQKFVAYLKPEVSGSA